MEIFTVDRNYKNAVLIDDFISVIWTERYFGDSEVEIVLPMSRDIFERVPVGTLIGCSKSDELMVLEEGSPESGIIKYTGIGILPWLNNRFFRYSPIQSETSIDLPSIGNPGEKMWNIIRDGATPESVVLNSTAGEYGIPAGYGERLKIPGLGLRDYDSVETIIDPNAYVQEFGPLYDLVRKIADTYDIGCKIDWKPDSLPILGFRAYRGLNRTSLQNVNPIVRFSPQLDSLTDIKELHSMARYKNLVFTYSTNAPLDYKNVGVAWTEEASGTNGFDVRAAHVMIDDIPDDPLDYAILLQILQSEAKKYLGSNKFVHVIDGQVVLGPQLKYGRDFLLGDLVEEQGDTGAVSIGRITEYIHAQDAYGEREYPTVGEVESINTTAMSLSAYVPETLPPPPPPEDSWIELTPTTMPDLRHSAGLAWDPVHSKVVMFDGSNGSTVVQETWLFDLTTGDWTDAAPVHEPHNALSTSFPPSSGFQKLAWDGTRIVFFTQAGSPSPITTVVFGWDGTDWSLLYTTSDHYSKCWSCCVWTGSYVLSVGKYEITPTVFHINRFPATWKWDGSTITELSPTQNIDPWPSQGMAASDGAGNTYYFGGDGTEATNPQNKIFKWNESTEDWDLLSPATSPPVRSSACFAYDPQRSGFILYGGGSGGSPAYRDDTWFWDGTNWTDITSTLALSPSGRYISPLCYTPDGVHLFGGLAAGTTPLGDMWKLFLNP